MKKIGTTKEGDWKGIMIDTEVLLRCVPTTAQIYIQIKYNVIQKALYFHINILFGGKRSIAFLFYTANSLQIVRNNFN